MAVSPLIMVRLYKYKIWHTQENDPVLLDLPSLARRHEHARVTSCVMSSRKVQSHWCLVAKQLLGEPYLWNRMVDFANFCMQSRMAMEVIS